jgi:hypothetical protein
MEGGSVWQGQGKVEKKVVPVVDTPEVVEEAPKSKSKKKKK